MSVFTRVKENGNSFIGIVTLLCGVGLLWSSAMSGREVSSTYSTMFERAAPIDLLQPDPSMNGKVVIGSGRLESLDRLGDEFLQPQPVLRLKRHVEMLQWVETFPDTGGNVRAAPPTYERAWREGQVDFFRFRVPEGHENPLLRYTSQEQSVTTAAFGAFNGKQLIAAIKVLKRLPIRPEMLKESGHLVQDDAIVIPRELGNPESLGSMRIWYEALLPGEYTVVAVQADENSLVGGVRNESLFIREGIFSLDELFAVETGESKRFFGGLVVLAGFLVFSGLAAVLSPFSAQLNLRPHFDLQGKAATAVLSGGISVIVVLVFWVLSFFG